MNVKAINSFIKSTTNPLQNNICKNLLAKSTNFHKSSTLIKTDRNSKQEKDVINTQMKHLISKLSITETSEFQAQNGMSFLQQKEKCLNTIKCAGEELKELSEKYERSDLTEKDKAKIEEQAEKILKGLDHLMNNDSSTENSTLDFKALPIKDIDERTTNILSKPIYITLEIDRLDTSNLNDNTNKKDTFNDIHFKNKVSTKNLLENVSIIEKSLLNPVQKEIQDVHDSKSKIYNKFIDEYWSSRFSINKLFNSGAISGYMKDIKNSFQESIYNSISSLCFQSSNINKDNVSELLK